ncbi:TPA: PT domain-containing protein [Streptococcus suis]|nr:PT domain-containing protein [Streptococcus suis]
MMNAKKLVKWGVALTSTLVLGGVVGPVGGNLANTTSVVYAEEMQSRVAVHAGYYFDGELAFAAFDLEEFWIGPGENKTIAVPVVDGYVYEGKYLLSNGNGERLLQGSPSARYEDTVGSSFVDVILIYAPAEKPVEQPVETPAAQPVETPTEQPTEKPVTTPTEQPVEKPITYRIHYFLNDVVENGGTPSYTDIAPYKEGVISKGETIVEVAPHIDGYAVYEVNSIPITYDHFTGDNVWHDNDWYPADGFLYNKIETPVDQPVEQPAEKPVEQPVETPIEQPADQPAETSTAQPVETPVEQPTEQPTEQPVDQPADQPAEQPVDQPVETPADQPAEQPTEQPVDQPVEQLAEQVVDTPTDKPVEQLTDASSLTEQPAGKVQAVTATDKKTVDKSAPSTPAVKPEEVSQPVAKTLPKTGDSSSMLLVLGGFLSGLSGLGLAATSRKRD